MSNGPLTAAVNRLAAVAALFLAAVLVVRALIAVGSGVLGS